MANLEFPIISGPFPEKKQLSMDDYLEFVQFNLKHSPDLEAGREWKKQLAVKTPFSISSAKQI